MPLGLEDPGPFGLPNWLILLALAIVGGLIILSKSGRRETRKKIEPAEEKPDITKLIGEPGGTVETEEPVTSVQKLLAGELENAPSIGPEEKTDVESTLSLLKVPEGEKKEKPVETPAESKVETKVKQKKGLADNEEKKSYIDLDEFEEDLEEPEPPEYEPPEIELPDGRKIKGKPTPPPKPKGRPKEKLEEVREELEKGKVKTSITEKAPEKIGKKGVRYFCMECFDAGMSPVKVTTKLRRIHFMPGEAKTIAMRTYKLWLEKREPIIKEIKETNEKIKRIQYKFLKRQIDEPTRKAMLIENQKKLIELEAKLKSTEDYFIGEAS